MKIGILQPYFFPYIGYFQLMNAVDELVVYDKTKYTKKGWFNRNRILVNGKDVYISLPLKGDSDFLDVKDRYLADNWNVERTRMLNRVKCAYIKAPFFDDAFQLFEQAVLFENRNLFDFLFNSLILIKKYLDIETPLVISSTIEFDQSLKAEEKVIGICKARHADQYVNPIGGFELYSEENFNKEGIGLYFLKTSHVEYAQFGAEFQPSLSILDVMMFNSKEEVKGYLANYYTLINQHKPNV